MARQEKVKCHCTAAKRPTCTTCGGEGYRYVSQEEINHEIATWMVMFSAFQFQTQKLHGNLKHQIKHVFNGFLKQGNKLHDMFLKKVEEDDTGEEYNADHSTFILQVVEKASRIRHRKQLVQVLDEFLSVEAEAIDADNPKYSEKLDGVKVVGKIDLEET